MAVRQVVARVHKIVRGNLSALRAAILVTAGEFPSYPTVLTDLASVNMD